MTDQLNTVKTTKKGKKALPTPTSKSFLTCGSTSLSKIKPNRLSLFPTLKNPKATNSLDSFISEEETADSHEYENYQLEYSTYLLRKLQNRILEKNNANKEEGFKKCLVFLKLELEDLLNKFVSLTKDVNNWNVCFKLISESNSRIECGRKVLQALKENKVDVVLKSLSEILDQKTNQLQLVDIDKSVIEDAISNNVLGPESELQKILNKIQSSTEKNKEIISDIANEIRELEAISVENFNLKKRFSSVLETICKDILDTSYEKFTDVVRTAYKRREELIENGSMPFDFEYFNLEDLFKSEHKPVMSEQQLNASSVFNLDGSYSVKPKCTSTPQPE